MDELEYRLILLAKFVLIKEKFISKKVYNEIENIDESNKKKVMVLTLLFLVIIESCFN